MLSMTPPPGRKRALRIAATACALLARAALADDTPAKAPDAAQPTLVAAAAPAAAIPATPPAPAAKADAAPIGRGPHRWGLQLDGGAPDGAAVNVLYRPRKYVRFSGGMLYNLASYGVRGGVSVQPYFPIAPSLTLEAGHYFNGDVYSAVSKYTHVDESLKPTLSRVGYTFVSAQVGLELGHPNWFVFFVRGGISQVWASAGPFQNTTLSSKGTDVNARIPDAKVGFMLFFY